MWLKKQWTLFSFFFFFFLPLTKDLWLTQINGILKTDPWVCRQSDFIVLSVPIVSTGSHSKCDNRRSFCPQPCPLGPGWEGGSSWWFRRPHMDLWCWRGTNFIVYNAQLLQCTTSKSEKRSCIVRGVGCLQRICHRTFSGILLVLHCQQCVSCKTASLPSLVSTSETIKKLSRVKSFFFKIFSIFNVYVF